MIATLERDNLIRIVADTRKVEESDKIFGCPMVAGCLYAPTRYITKNPEIIQGLTNAVVRADKWLAKATAEELTATVPESYFLGNKAIYIDGFLKNRPALSKDGDRPRWRSGDFSEGSQSVNPKMAGFKVDLDAVYTNKFAIEANKRYPA